ncbi:molybdate ABC transporter substrate-binding protein [Oleidesulfovibrio sp.]|uniref:molybdate ABC transporter substrate-binding protein n=1 Tax=Oleidesulfovibrio sp. TaxID=2909707 RepID=UPI003A85C6F5
MRSRPSESESARPLFSKPVSHTLKHRNTMLFEAFSLKQASVLLLFLWCVFTSFSPAAAADPPASEPQLVLASGAGYKKMVNALVQQFTRSTGITVDRIYGNMGRVTTLAGQTGKVDMVIGDQTYLHGAGLPFAQELILGHGKLVLACPKGHTITSPDVLDDAGMQRIALPDASKAIYGIAAREYLTATGRLPAIKPRLIEVATVPQVFSYLTAGEVDLGFMNLTHALNVADKLGGYLVLNASKHKPILIMAGLLDGAPAPQAALSFLTFLATPQAKTIIQKHGL